MALVHDLSDADSDEAGDLLLRWRRQHPGCPILLYYPSGSRYARLAGRMSLLPGVAGRLQRPGNPGEETELAAFLREFLRGRPELRIRAVLADLRPEVPRVAMALIETLLTRLQRGYGGAPQVDDLARTAGLSVPAVRQACRLAGLPGPSRLVRWVTLIYILALAEGQGLSIAWAADRADLADSYARKLRRALIPEVQRLTGALLPAAVALFRAECDRHSRAPPSK